MPRLIRRVLSLAACALATCCFMPFDCGGRAPPPQSQFGTYHDANKWLRLANGDTVTVYRVKYWVFSSGEAPALQLEYATRVDVGDTDEVLRADRVLWPAFAPYVEHLHLTNAIMTATALFRVDGRLAQVSRHRSFGFVMHKDVDGLWRIKGHPEPLPPADRSGVPMIFEADGTPMAFMTSPPQPIPSP